MDPYQVLGISFDATVDEIKRAYRFMSRKNSADCSKGSVDEVKAQKRFDEIQKAYSMLMKSKWKGNFSYSRRYRRNTKVSLRKKEYEVHVGGIKRSIDMFFLNLFYSYCF